MAKLTSEDENITSSIEIFFLAEQIKQKPSNTWIPYKLILKSGIKEITYQKKDSSKGSGDYVLAVKPINEIENLICGINNLIKDSEVKTFLFEPAEPTFELIIEKSHKGYSVNFWVDAGNVISDHYTWDGFGIRFFTNKEKLLSFTEELKKEMQQLGVYAETN